MKRVMRIVIIVVCSLAVFITLFIGASSIMDAPLKKALHTITDTERRFIICQRTSTGAYQWQLIEASENDDAGTYIIVNGNHPFADYHFRPEFELASNEFVLYITGREEVYSDYYDGYVIQYNCSGWDIMYPVDHGTLIGLLKSSEYIYESDLTSILFRSANK